MWPCTGPTWPSAATSPEGEQPAVLFTAGTARLFALGRHVELEKYDVTILDHVFLALLPVFAGCLDCILTAQLLQVLVGHHLHGRRVDAVSHVSQRNNPLTLTAVRLRCHTSYNLAQTEVHRQKVHPHLCTDEPALKVGVDGARSLWRLCALADLPALDLHERVDVWEPQVWAMPTACSAWFALLHTC